MNEENIKLILGYDLGSELHDAWRAPRKFRSRKNSYKLSL